MPRVLISHPDKAPQPYRFPVNCKTITIGNAESNDIVIDSPSVSGMHCQIRRVSGGYIIKDNDSTNGIKQGEVRLAIVDLFNESEIFIGDIPLLFQLTDEEIDIISEEEFVSHLKYHSSKKTKKLPDDKAALKKDEEKKPKLPKKVPKQAETIPSAPPKVIPQASSTSFGTLLFIALFGIALGICTRYYLVTGEFLLTDLLLKFTA